MQGFELEPYTEGHSAEWDALVEAAPMATFLHSRRFMSHHGDRFDDRSLLVRDAKSRLVAVFPAAVDPRASERVVSHPGLTYGGVVHLGDAGGAWLVEMLRVIRAHYAVEGFSALRYKAVPPIYHRRPSADDVYALVASGGALYRCDLSCAIDLHDRGRRSDRRRRGERKAERHGVEVRVGDDTIAELWHVLEENLAERHRTRPTHSLDDIRSLLSLVPEHVEVATATLDGETVAGVVLFTSPRVVHTQYIASSARGREASALDAVLERCIEGAQERGARYFDFGVSTEEEGRRLNADLHRFKAEFGGGGVVHEFYELTLNQ